MVPLYPRAASYDVLANTSIDKIGAELLSEAANKCWNAILSKDAVKTGKAITESFEAQIRMFPNMVNEDIMQQIDLNKNEALGWKVSGAGGGGYLIFFSKTPIKNAIQIRIRR
jgi:galactokinase/mevalonate kinase-like predicted kinase